MTTPYDEAGLYGKSSAARGRRSYLRRKGFDIPKFKPGMPTRSFFAEIAKTPSCWNWVGPKNSLGYGKYHYDGHSVFAHRYMWERLNGPIPKRMVIMHSCDNPSCVNPAHLKLGTHSQNRLDAIAKNRHAKGSRAGNAKLTDGHVLKIRKEYGAGKISLAALANKYEVDKALIWRVVKRTVWKHVI